MTHRHIRWPLWPSRVAKAGRSGTAYTCHTPVPPCCACTRTLGSLRGPLRTLTRARYTCTDRRPAGQTRRKNTSPWRAPSHPRSRPRTCAAGWRSLWYRWPWPSPAGRESCRSRARRVCRPACWTRWGRPLTAACPCASPCRSLPARSAWWSQLCSACWTFSCTGLSRTERAPRFFRNPWTWRWPWIQGEESRTGGSRKSPRTSSPGTASKSHFVGIARSSPTASRWGCEGCWGLSGTRGDATSWGPWRRRCCSPSIFPRPSRSPRSTATPERRKRWIRARLSRTRSSQSRGCSVWGCRSHRNTGPEERIEPRTYSFRIHREHQPPSRWWTPWRRTLPKSLSLQPGVLGVPETPLNK